MTSPALIDRILPTHVLVALHPIYTQHTLLLYSIGFSGKTEADASSCPIACAGHKRKGKKKEVHATAHTEREKRNNTEREEEEGDLFQGTNLKRRGELKAAPQEGRRRAQ